MIYQVVQVVHNGEVIGTSHLESRDRAMALALGPFYPLPAYESVRPIFRMFTRAVGNNWQSTDQDQLARYYAARNALGLKLVSSDGVELATGHIHIVDWEETDELELEVHVVDERFWTQAAQTSPGFFIQTKPPMHR